MQDRQGLLYPNINELYQASEHNYPWEQFKYLVPQQYHHSNPSQPPPHSQPAPKLNYLDHLIKDKQKIPAPNAYNNSTPSRPLSGKMDRKPRKTVTEEAISKQKNEQIPGPGAYLTRPKTADNKINRNMPEHRQHYLNEVEYIASENPGVGQYNLNQKTSVSAPKYFKGSSQNHSTRTKTEKSYKGKLTSTLVVGTFDWLAAQKRPCHKNFFGKCRRFEGTSKYEKKPGPTSYKLNNKWNDPNQILKTTSSFTNLKSVYYS